MSARFRQRQEPPHQRARYWRMPRRGASWSALLGLAVWLGIGLVAAIGIGGYTALDDTIEQARGNSADAREARAATDPVLPGQPVNVLLIGSDARPDEGDRGRSDTLLLVRMDRQRGFISMLSFPRDLYVNIPGQGMGKINEAYSTSTKAAMDTVSELTGEPINEYVAINFQAFAKLVNTVGGVYLDVDRRYFNENTGGLSNYAPIDLQAGYQKLNGNDALDYVRYRHTDSDYARIARQQQFLSELKRQVRKPEALLGNALELRRIFGHGIELSMSTDRFVSLLQLAISVPKDKIARVSIQGQDDMTSGGASIQTASEQEVDRAVGEWRDPSFIQDRARNVDPASVDVTVLNGSGRLLAAEDAAQALSEKKYRARVGGNDDTFDHTQTVAYYAPGFRDAAVKVAALLGEGASSAPLSDAEARGNEVVVVLGTDFTGELQPPPKPVTEEPARTIDTTSVAKQLRTLPRVPGFTLMAPTKVAQGSSLKIVRSYKIGNAPAVKLVFATGRADGSRIYWGIEMTSMVDPPILEGETGAINRGNRRTLTYYDGKKLQREAFQKDGVTYWVSNSINADLNANTIHAIIRSMRPLATARVAAGATDTPIQVETEGSTP